MKPKLYMFGSAGSAIFACLCAAPARRYAFTAYSLWLSRFSGEQVLPMRRAFTPVVASWGGLSARQYERE
jgi:hypothetical protein